ncbi:MAG TPA: hypothetical protein IAB56_03190 [Candidatus Scybalousia intestinigallinarum]|nr:hypothetical protein [Candidatus Scybalousia intestinigallinarum]
MAKSTNSTNKKKGTLSNSKPVVKLKSKQTSKTVHQKNIPTDTKKERAREKAIEKSRQAQKTTVAKKKKVPATIHLTNVEAVNIEKKTKNRQENTVDVLAKSSVKPLDKEKKVKKDANTRTNSREKETKKAPVSKTKNQDNKKEPISKNKTKVPEKKQPVLSNGNSSKEEILKSKNEKSFVQPATPSKVSSTKKKLSSFLSFLTTKRIIHLLLFIVIAFLLVYGVYFLFFRKNENVSLDSYDSLNSLILDGTDIVAVGSSNFRYSDFVSYTGGNEQAKLIKYNKKGEVLFETAFTDGIISQYYSIVEVDDGYVVVGSYQLDPDDQINIGLIVFYDKDGKLVWKNELATSGNTIFYDVDSVSDGYIVVGQSLSDQTGENGAVIAKYSTSGSLVWKKYFGSTDSTAFKAVEVAKDKIYAVGLDQKDMGILVCFQLNGQYSWHKEYLYTDDLGLSDIYYFKNNLYVVGGKKVLDSDSTDNERITSNTDALILKYSLDGELLFEKSFGGSNLEHYNSLTAYGSNLYVVGYSNSTDSGLKIFTDGVKKAGIFVKYDLDGEMEKKTVYGGSNDDNLTAIVTDNSNLYITGYSNSKDGNLLSSHENGRDYFGKLVKVDSRLRVLFIK